MIESMEETVLRLDAEISAALEADDLARAARAQRELRKVQLERPSAACRHHIQEDCRAAAALLRLGDAVDVDSRVRAAKKLGRWLRWRRAGPRDLVPVATALDGLLWGLRSEPEVAWAAQCALYHAARCADGMAQSVKEGTRGTISRLLLNEPAPFPFCLPELTPESVERYERAISSAVVCDFFSKLRSLTLVDPGYGDSVEDADLDEFLPFCKRLCHSFDSLQSLKVLGFEDCAMAMILPHLMLPKLRSLHIIGACQTEEAQLAILSTLHRHGPQLAELELNIWTEFLSEAEDPLVHLAPMTQVRRLTVRAPPLAVPWEHFARIFPALEELTFLYDQDFAMNCNEVLEDEEDIGETQELLERHALWYYRDAVVFARDLHRRGFRRLAAQCPRLQEIRLAIADSSFGYDMTAPEERLALSWRRDSAGSAQPFRRDQARNGATRTTLEEASSPMREPAAFLELGSEEEVVTEEQAVAAGAAVMLQVVRLFDDPSLEAEFGIRQM